MNNSIRQSNMELLRILAAIFVLTVHCNGLFLNVHGDFSYQSGGIVSQLWRLIVNSITFTGVNLFILISGYFSIKPKLQSIINLFTILIFFYTGGYFLDCFLGNDTLSLKNTILRTVLHIEDNWFIMCYLYLILFAPMINVFMDSLNERQCTFFALIFVAFAIFYGCLRPSEYIAFGKGYSISSMILVYVIGRYLRLWGEQYLKKINNISLTAIFILFTAISVVLWYTNFRVCFLAGYHSPVVFIPSVAIFLLFSRINIQSKAVNYIASSSLAVFIFHCCTPVMQWIIKFDNEWFGSCTFGGWLWRISALIVVVFIMSVALDKVREWMVKPLIRKSAMWDQSIRKIFSNAC